MAPKSKKVLSKFISRDDAVKFVSKIMKQEDCGYQLIPFKEFQSGNKSSYKSTKYEKYDVLVKLNTKEHVGFLVCMYLQSGSCSLPGAVQSFSTGNGTSTLSYHSEKHESNASECLLPVSLPLNLKKNQQGGRHCLLC